MSDNTKITLLELAAGLTFAICVTLMAVLVAMGAFIEIPKAHATEARVRSACVGDYFLHCSDTVPDSQECKDCFRRVGPNLSKACLRAIQSSAEFGNEYESQRKNYMAR